MTMWELKYTVGNEEKVRHVVVGAPNRSIAQDMVADSYNIIRPIHVSMCRAVPDGEVFLLNGG